MTRLRPRYPILPAALLCLAYCGPPADSNLIQTEDGLRRAIAEGTGEIQLAPGVIEVSSPIDAPDGTHDLGLTGHPSGTTLRVSPAFAGRAVLVFHSAENVKLSGFSIEGHRKAVKERVGIPPDNETFTSFFSNNGIIFEDVRGLDIAAVRFTEIAAFPIIVNQGHDVRIEGVHIRNSGSLNERGRNNTSGGILLEEGTADFVVRNCTFENVRGNGIWTHSRYESPRNRDGRIEGNRFKYIARDAIQVGHATRIRVEGNHGERIGYPFHYTDVEGQGYPVGIDTAGNTDESVYANNTFEEINGKCIDLDGFHHGEVRGNRCTNKGTAIDYPLGHFAIIMNNTNPDMNSEQIVIEDNEVDGAIYGGLFIIGSGHRVVNNRFRNLNRAQCVEGSADMRCHFWLDEPALLRTGIYLGRQAERPAVTRVNVIEGNVISGFGMVSNCIAAAPGVRLAANRVDNNDCRDERMIKKRSRLDVGGMQFLTPKPQRPKLRFDDDKTDK